MSKKKGVKQSFAINHILSIELKTEIVNIVFIQEKNTFMIRQSDIIYKKGRWKNTSTIIYNQSLAQRNVRKSPFPEIYKCSKVQHVWIQVCLWSPLRAPREWGKLGRTARSSTPTPPRASPSARCPVLVYAQILTLLSPPKTRFWVSG